MTHAGDWTPGNTAGAFYPYVNPMMPIRIAARSNSVTYFMFTGFLERLPLENPGRDDYVLQATAVDALKVFGLQRTPVSRATIVEALDPVAWWRMTDAATADSSTAGGAPTWPSPVNRSSTASAGLAMGVTQEPCFAKCESWSGAPPERYGCTPSTCAVVPSC